jgi:hypothetical protein
MTQDPKPTGRENGAIGNTTRCANPELGLRLAVYELGVLPPDEQAAFEEHLRTCDACAEDLYANAPTTAVIHGAPARLAARLDVALRAREETPAARPRLARAWAALHDWFRPRGWTEAWRPLLPVAVAAVLVILVIRSPGGPTDLAGLARIEPLPYQRLETRAAGTDEGRRLFAQGMDAYIRAAYPEAAALLSRAIPLLRSERSRDASDQAAIHAGVSFLLAGNADSAATCLEIAHGSPLPVLADRARWYLAQAALRRADAHTALRLLDSLALGSPGYGARAAEQLRAVRGAMKRR